MAQLDRVLRRILQDWGHDIILQRVDRCTGKFLEPLERHTVRNMFPGVRGLPRVQAEQTEGVVYNVDMLYCFKADVKPKEGDRIYERDDRYPEGQTTYIIDYATPHRGKLGKIVYYTVGANRESPN